MQNGLVEGIYWSNWIENDIKESEIVERNDKIFKVSELIDTRTLNERGEKVFDFTSIR